MFSWKPNVYLFRCNEYQAIMFCFEKKCTFVFHWNYCFSLKLLFTYYAYVSTIVKVYILIYIYSSSHKMSFLIGLYWKKMELLTTFDFFCRLVKNKIPRHLFSWIWNLMVSTFLRSLEFMYYQKTYTLPIKNVLWHLYL